MASQSDSLTQCFGTREDAIALVTNSRRLTTTANMRVAVRFIAFALSVALAADAAFADSWQYKAEVDRQVRSFGDVRLVQIVDGTRNQKFPDFALEIYQGDRLVAALPGLAFDDVVASPDNEVFLGLSNRGMPGVAVALISRTGRVIALASHGVSDFDYCQRSVTLERVWYDESHPDVRFQLDGSKPGVGIFVRGCRGNELNVLTAIGEALLRSAAAHENSNSH